MSLTVAPFESFPMSFIFKFDTLLIILFLTLFIVKFSTLLIISFQTSFFVKFVTWLIILSLLFLCGLNVSTMTLFDSSCSSFITLFIASLIFTLDNVV